MHQQSEKSRLMDEIPMVESYQSHGLELIVTGVSLNHPAFQKKTAADNRSAA
jgi:hypothetical protein